jgi:putative SOS response-associated peptidase YedK
MCGRAAQTLQVANLAATSLGAAQNNNSTRTDGGNSTSQNSTSKEHYEQRDNYNMSPGMDALVTWKEDGKITMDRKVWGLVTKGGTQKSPLPSDSKTRMQIHFGNLMYNARSDTLYTKPTFSRLANQGRSCIVALDGFFEWKKSPLPGGKGKKQPYFVYRKASEENKKHPYLLLAGLWTRVSTGIPEAPTLDTFTILTTEACQQIQWLHHRMPVCIWDMKLGTQWLDNPSVKVHKALDDGARLNNEGFDWHMVTTDMSSVKFRENTAVQAMKGPKSVSSFFSKPSAKDNTDSAEPQKRQTELTETPEKGQEKEKPAGKQSLKRTPAPISSPSPKKVKTNTPAKGCITAFFQKKG